MTNHIKEIGNFMTKWLEDTLAAIVRIAKGRASDPEMKQQVADLTSKFNELADKLRDNDAADEGQKETAAELKAAFDALVNQLADAPPPEELPPAA